MTKRRKRQINRELAAIASLKDSDIDTSDIPEITDWSQAVVGSVYRSGKMDTSQTASISEGLKSYPLLAPDAQQFTGTVFLETTGQTKSSGAVLSQMTSQQLILGCVQGQTAAWEEFIRRFQKLISIVVLKMSRQWGNTSSQLTEDLIQDVYLKLAAEDFALLRKFQPRHEDSILGFIKIVASNVVYAHFRATRAMKLGGDEPLLSVDTAGSVDAVAQAERDVVLEEINRLLQGHASERDRAIFWLHYRHGLTAKEIASIPESKLTVRGVESVLHRLTQSLKILIQAPAKSQQGAAALPLTYLNERSFDQLLHHTRPSPKKKP